MGHKNSRKEISSSGADCSVRIIVMSVREFSSRLTSSIAAEHRKHLATDVAGAGRCRQEHVGRGDLLRLGGPFHRHLAPELGHFFRSHIRRIQMASTPVPELRNSPGYPSPPNSRATDLVKA